MAIVERPGCPTLDLLAEILPGIIRAFPWPKSMRWGAAPCARDALRWVRPLHSIVATFGRRENEEPDIVPFEIDGVAAGNLTRDIVSCRCRKFASAASTIIFRRSKRRRSFWIPRRKDIVLHDARDLAFAQGFELIEDEGLLEEVAGLVEWPVTLMGSFDESFLAIPQEAIRATIPRQPEVLRAEEWRQARQPLHSGVEHPRQRRRQEIVAGNQRVVAARLVGREILLGDGSENPLEDRVPKLDRSSSTRSSARRASA